MRLFFKILGVVFGLLFFLSAVLQYNDPDPFVWIVIYGIATVVSFRFAFTKVSFWLLFILAIAGFVGFLYVFPTNFEGFEIGKGNIKNIEEAREAFGLLIISVLFFLFGLRAKKQN